VLQCGGTCKTAIREATEEEVARIALATQRERERSEKAAVAKRRLEEVRSLDPSAKRKKIAEWLRSCFCSFTSASVCPGQQPRATDTTLQDGRGHHPKRSS
jgi:hypothetical protein